MIKEIERPDWFNSSGLILVSSVENWFGQTIEPLNKAIREGVEVSGKLGVGHTEPSQFYSASTDWLETYGYKDITHKALLIGIEKIKKESCADVLRDILENGVLTPNGISEKRAKAALANEGE